MVNVFSFCLYGPENPRYYPGMLENISIVEKHFPDWKVYVYIGDDVEPSMVEKLGTYPNTLLRFTHVLGAANMIHRFYAIDEPGVDLMLVRDADSRIHWKDRWAIREFMKRPEFVAHTIRDHIEHTAYMMGGLWGIRKSSGLNLTYEYSKYREATELGHRHGHDQNFLADVIYPKVVSKLLVHYSSNERRLTNETAVEFPFEWIDDIYCGRIESGFCETQQPPIKKSLTPSIIKILHRR